MPYDNVPNSGRGDSDGTDFYRADSYRADSYWADSASPPSYRDGQRPRPAGTALSALAESADVGRIDVATVVARLRHLDASPEPAMVFSQLSAVFVPAVCDVVSIDLVEGGGHRYRIRRPSSAIGSAIGTSIPTANGLTAETLPGTANSATRGMPDLSAPIGSVAADPELGSDSVAVAVHSPEGGLAGPPFAGVVACRWREGYAPTPADGALIRLMVDHAVALIQRDRLTSRVPDLGDQPDLRRGRSVREHLTADGATRVDNRIDTAVGIVMSLHHLDQPRAIDMLVRLSHRARRQIQEVAETIVDTGVLPDPDGGGSTGRDTAGDQSGWR